MGKVVCWGVRVCADDRGRGGPGSAGTAPECHIYVYKGTPGRGNTFTWLVCMRCGGISKVCGEKRVFL